MCRLIVQSNFVGSASRVEDLVRMLDLTLTQSSTILAEYSVMPNSSFHRSQPQHRSPIPSARRDLGAHIHARASCYRHRQVGNTHMQSIYLGGMRHSHSAGIGRASRVATTVITNVLRMGRSACSPWTLCRALGCRKADLSELPHPAYNKHQAPTTPPPRAPAATPPYPPSPHPGSSHSRFHAAPPGTA